MPPPKPTPSRTASAAPIVRRVLLGLLLTGVLTLIGLGVGFALIGPCPRIEPRWLLPYVAFGPGVLGYSVGVATTLFLGLRGPRRPAS